MEYETAMDLLSAQVEFLLVISQHEKEKKTQNKAYQHNDEGRSEGVGVCSVPFPEKAEAHALLPSGT